MQSETTYQTPEGLATLLSKKEQHILDNQMEINWLKRQIEQRQQDYESYRTINLKVKQLSDDEVQEQLKYYLQQVETLRVNMDIVSQFNLSKERIGTNLDDNHYTLEAQYPQPHALDDTRTLQIQEFLMKRDKLVVEAMQLLDQLKKTENQAAHLHEKIVGKYQDNQQLWTNLEITKLNIEQQAENEIQSSMAAESQGRATGSKASVVSTQTASERSQEKLYDTLNRLEIAKNVLMGLILESNIDWASDRKWSRVMLSIGTEEDD